MNAATPVREALEAAAALDNDWWNGEHADALAALDELVAENARQRAGLEAIRDEREPCRKCGKAHKWRSGKDRLTTGTWADPDDGHVYYRMSAPEIAREALAGSGGDTDGGAA